MNTYEIFQQQPPMRFGEHFEVNLIKVGEAMAQNGADAINQAKGLRLFANARGLAKFPIVGLKEDCRIWH